MNPGNLCLLTSGILLLGNMDQEWFSRVDTGSVKWQENSGAELLRGPKSVSSGKSD